MKVQIARSSITGRTGNTRLLSFYSCTIFLRWENSEALEIFQVFCSCNDRKIKILFLSSLFIISAYGGGADWLSSVRSRILNSPPRLIFVYHLEICKLRSISTASSHVKEVDQSALPVSAWVLDSVSAHCRDTTVVFPLRFHWICTAVSGHLSKLVTSSLMISVGLETPQWFILVLLERDCWTESIYLRNLTR